MNASKGSPLTVTKYNAVREFRYPTRSTTLSIVQREVMCDSHFPTKRCFIYVSTVVRSTRNSYSGVLRVSIMDVVMNEGKSSFGIQIRGSAQIALKPVLHTRSTSKRHTIQFRCR